MSFFGLLLRQGVSSPEENGKKPSGESKAHLHFASASTIIMFLAPQYLHYPSKSDSIINVTDAGKVQ
jgi:hypothetical protein